MAQNRTIKQTAPGETTVYINPRWDTGTHYEKTTKPIAGGGSREHSVAAAAHAWTHRWPFCLLVRRQDI